jgi:hypothetical protein
MKWDKGKVKELEILSMYLSRKHLISSNQDAGRQSTHSTPGSEAWGMLRVDTERRFYPDLKIGVWRRRTYQLFSNFLEKFRT